MELYSRSVTLANKKMLKMYNCLVFSCLINASFNLIYSLHFFLHRNIQRLNKVYWRDHYCCNSVVFPTEVATQPWLVSVTGGFDIMFLFCGPKLGEKQRKTDVPNVCYILLQSYRIIIIRRSLFYSSRCLAFYDYLSIVGLNFWCDTFILPFYNPCKTKFSNCIVYYITSGDSCGTK